MQKKKTENVDFTQIKAEDIDFENESFDCIVCNFAFHHFENKQKVLENIWRILKKDGLFKLKNMSPFVVEDGWWIYKYFPKALEEDRKRFWTNKNIFAYLDNLGFKTKLNVNYQINYIDFESIYEQVKLKETSQFQIISDKDYDDGLNKILEDMKNNKNYLNEFALIECIAFKC